MPTTKVLPHLIQQRVDCKTGLEGFMANLQLDTHPVHLCLSQSASDLQKIGLTDVSDCSGFIPQVLRDALR